MEVETKMLYNQVVAIAANLAHCSQNCFVVMQFAILTGSYTQRRDPWMELSGPPAFKVVIYAGGCVFTYKLLVSTLPERTSRLNCL